jgi:extradiol dioxygenase family protein/anti-anti-sigma regulatory factor
MAALASILAVVAWHMSEWRTFRDILHAPRSDVLVLLVTFVLTVVVDLTVAIQVGMVLAAFLFMKRMAEVTNVTAITGELEDPAEPSPDTEAAIFRRSIPSGVEVYEINGPFFFGAASTFSHTVAEVTTKPRVLIIRLRHVPALDATGIHALKRVIDDARRNGTRVVLAELQPQPFRALDRAGILAALGPGGAVSSLDDALEASLTGSATCHYPFSMPPSPFPRTAMPLAPFHLAFPVDDLHAARRFYGGLLGCREGRSSDQWIDFDFHGHQVVAHLAPDEVGQAATNAVDGHAVPVRHFGVVLDWDAWHALAERLRGAGVDFVIEPGIRFAGQVGEQATMFFLDPAGNALEFKAFKDPSQLFAR